MMTCEDATPEWPRGLTFCYKPSIFRLPQMFGFDLRSRPIDVVLFTVIFDPCSVPLKIIVLTNPTELWSAHLLLSRGQVLV